MAQSQQLVRFDEEETAPIDGDISARLLDDDRARRLALLTVLVISDYAKGLLNPELVAAALVASRMARA